MSNRTPPTEAHRRSHTGTPWRDDGDDNNNNNNNNNNKNKNNNRSINGSISNDRNFAEPLSPGASDPRHPFFLSNARGVRQATRSRLSIHTRPLL
jgi:hypothetical protein